MEEELDIILQAVDNASDTFQDVASAAEDMGQSMQDGAEAGTQGFEEVEESAEGAMDPMEGISDILGGFIGAEVFTQLADALWDLADRAGTFEDSLMRARLEAEGAGIGVNAMTDAVSELSATTGRAGSEIRESFIKATARGITDLDSFKSMMTGVGAQATLFGTDIQSMADKFSNMAMRSTLMERSLASTGITMEELADAMGMTGATADEVKEKWQELDTNQRAAILGTAASMNEGQTANEEYKKSWAGLQAQIEIAKGRILRLAGEVLLPVLVPALELAARVLNWLGDSISALVNGPFGGLISVVGAAAAAFALAVPAYMAVQGALTLLTATAIPAATALWSVVAPLLPFIAVGAAIVALIYEIGKAFGWWTDVSTMLDAIWAGIQRLWSAFINHPDVQGFLSALTTAWNWLVPAVTGVVNAVLMFFGVTSSSNFDFVRSCINAIGSAWNTLTAPIRLVIRVIQLLWTTTNTVGNNIHNTINNIHAWFVALPGHIRSAISTIASILMEPFQAGYNKITEIVNNIISAGESIKNISLSGLVGNLTKPFSDAYNSIVDWAHKTYTDAQSWYNKITSGGHAAGGEELLLLNAGIKNPGTSYSTSGALKVDQNIKLTLDLENIPQNVDEEIVYGIIRESFSDKTVLNALVNNTVFQDMDQRAKNRISMRNGRARGGGV